MPDQEQFRHAAGTVDGSPLHRSQTQTVYDEIAHLLIDRGWVQGVDRRGRALSLRTAIDAAVGVDPASRSAPTGVMLARSGRIAAHLRDLTGERNLDAWSDDATRTLPDILELLTCAAVGFAQD